MLPDQPHHPGDPHLNFLPLYLSILAVFLISVGVKLGTVLLKKRRAKKRNPDEEQATINEWEKFWFPWRYDKHGRKRQEFVVDPKASTSGTRSSRTGKSSEGSSSATLVGDDAVPQLPPLAHHRESKLDRLVYRAENATDDGVPGSPALMTGALAPNGLSSPIPLDTFNKNNSGFESVDLSDNASPGAKARASFISDSDSSRSRLPLVNPFTSRPFRSTSESTDSSWTPTKRSATKPVPGTYGNLGPVPDEPDHFDSDISNKGKGKAAAYDDPRFESGVMSGTEIADFAGGYGAGRSGTSSRRNDQHGEHKRGDKDHQRSHHGSSRDKHQQSSRTREGSSCKPTKERQHDKGTSSSSRHHASSSRTHASSSRDAYQSSSSRKPSTSSQVPPPPTGKLGGSFKGVVRGGNQTIAELEAQRKKKAEEAEAERQRRKAEKKEGKKSEDKKAAWK